MSAQSVWLDQVEISGYRSCKNTSFRPDEKLTALIGINGAGKTNVLLGIALLKARGQVTRRIMDDLAEDPEIVLTAWFGVGEYRVGLQIKYQLDAGASRGINEQLLVTEKWNFHTFTGSRAWLELPPLDFWMAGARSHKFYRSSGVFLSRNSEAASFPTAVALERMSANWASIVKNQEIIRALKAIDEYRSSITYYSASQFIDPSRCPSTFEVDEDGRLTDPYVVSAKKSHLKFLHDLYQLRMNNRDLYDGYCDFISRKQLGLISRITWKEIELSSSTAEVKGGGGVKKIRKLRRLVIPKVQVGRTFITFNQLSEGTFKTLALIFYIHTNTSRLLMVEEPEVCVHHGLLSGIVATLKSHSATKQILISTHSDQLIDELTPENIFVVEMQKGETRVTGLSEWLDGSALNALHDYLNETGTLGEYWRAGGFS